MAEIAPGLDGYILARQHGQQRQQAETGALMQLLQVQNQMEQAAQAQKKQARADSEYAMQDKFRSALAGLGENPTNEQIIGLAAKSGVVPPKDLISILQGAENKKLQIQATGQREQARIDELFRHRRALETTAEGRAAVDAAYRQATLTNAAENTYYTTGVRTQVPDLVGMTQQRTGALSAQPNFATEGGMSPMPQQGALSALLQPQQSQPAQAPAGLGFPTIPPQVQASRDAEAAAIRDREINGGGIPTSSVIAQPSRIDSREFARIGQTPAPVTARTPAPVVAPAAAPQQAASTTGGPNYRAALAEVIPNEPPRVKFERLAAARKADQTESARAVKLQQIAKKEADSAKVFNNTVDDIVGTIDQMIGKKGEDKPHPGLKAAVGTIDPLFPTIFKDTANFDALYKALLSKASVEGLTTIRGNGTAVGSITEKEWPIFQNFRAVLNDRQGEDAFVEHLKRYRDTLIAGKKSVEMARQQQSEGAADVASTAPAQNGGIRFLGFENGPSR